MSRASHSSDGGDAMPESLRYGDPIEILADVYSMFFWQERVTLEMQPLGDRIRQCLDEVGRDYPNKEGR